MEFRPRQTLASRMNLYSEDVIRERFESKYIPEPNAGCWLWTDYLDPKGYGYLRVSPTWMPQAHRVSYWLHAGVWSDQTVVIDHLCRVPCCVNPDHLELVTQQVNILRGAGMGAKWAQRTHCSKGHPFTLDNVASGLSENRRRCLICRRVADQLRGIRRRKL